MTAGEFRDTRGAAWLILVWLILQVSSAASDQALHRRFAKPPAEARMLKIIHSWPDDPRAQDELIRQLTRQGFGGVVCNVSFDDYLVNEVKWQAFQRAVGEAKKAGWSLWLYDERGYPSGNAGGLVLRDHPEWEAQGLLIVDAETDGAKVTLTLPPGKLFLAAAFPVRGFSNRPITTIWTSPDRSATAAWNGSRPLAAGRFSSSRRAGCSRGPTPRATWPTRSLTSTCSCPSRPGSSLTLTHQRYADRLGTNLGATFVSTFTDEPSLMSAFLRPMPYRVLPWAPDLARQFHSRRGYALEPIVPELILEAGPASRKLRYDFWLTIGELVSENYFGQIQDWCRRHNLRSGGHLLMEESLAAHVSLYGDFFRCARRLDAPSIDCLSSLPAEVPWYIARLVASAGELEQKTVVMCETSDHAQRYRPEGDKRPVRDVTEAEIRGTCNRLIVGGVNSITSYYSFAGLSDLALQRLNNWVGRCCTMLSGGHQVAEIALVYPISSVWPRFVPSNVWTRQAHDAARVESIFRAGMDSLFNARRDFTVVDARALSEAKVEHGTLVHGSLRWSVVVLPGVDTLPQTAWENLARFVKEGGVVIALGALPENDETEFPSSRIQALSREIFGPESGRPVARGNNAGGGGIFLPQGSEGLLPIALNGVLAADVSVAEAAAPLRMTHRRIEGKEVYFLINDSPRSWQGDVGFAADGDAEIWDPADGTSRPFGSSRSITLALEPYGAKLVRFARPPASPRHRLESGDLPSLIVTPLPSVEPTTAHGEFVNATLTREPASDATEEPRFRATATLRKNKVDNHLFVRFHYGSRQDLIGGDCLVLDTWTPKGQKTPATLLVILHEDGGGDFLAQTTRALGRQGHERSFVPLSQFQAAGWSHDADGVLDLSRITDVSIGWGGYFGESDERVEFQVAPPRLGTTKGQTGR